MQIYKKVFFLWLILAALSPGCAKDLAPQTQTSVPGKSNWKNNRDQRRRARQAYWYKRNSNRVTRKSDRKMARLKRQFVRAEQKMQEQHIKKQSPEVQKRMKENQKEAEQNNSKRTLRQKLRLWKFKK